MSREELGRRCSSPERMSGCWCSRPAVWSRFVGGVMQTGM
nr:MULTISPECIES: hypothetical protein [Streptomyces]